ncbi:uncharacterized protein L969DRAFT_15589 [Mixia osmundae IAM 14324]|uniref:Uncharacterized protein n=1 Tax=Mixia osmundae (strain CBS 9802 / IAM 14324 / JCM 22182 / KY 12970) TaxID=764103 RepID=G7DYK4_MIXOS|nr:uncharacterized protein L969DRAFT_15589 [Mixia osmundae IAM 14324]KEI41564.1 hypothetical protein L969DRAFT_15589 [Mixia osmundae IAM 14324]GAA95664.1 hypothetical protein E5Q_02321 [Mixia osmundae IAM 14324]
MDDDPWGGSAAWGAPKSALDEAAEKLSRPRTPPVDDVEPPRESVDWSGNGWSAGGEPEPATYLPRPVFDKSSLAEQGDTPSWNPSDELPSFGAPASSHGLTGFASGSSTLEPAYEYESSSRSPVQEDEEPSFTYGGTSDYTMPTDTHDHDFGGYGAHEQDEDEYTGGHSPAEESRWPGEELDLPAMPDAPPQWPSDESRRRSLDDDDPGPRSDPWAATPKKQARDLPDESEQDEEQEEEEVAKPKKTTKGKQAPAEDTTIDIEAEAKAAVEKTKAAAGSLLSMFGRRTSATQKTPVQGSTGMSSIVDGAAAEEDLDFKPRNLDEEPRDKTATPSPSAAPRSGFFSRFKRTPVQPKEAKATPEPEEPEPESKRIIRGVEPPATIVHSQTLSAFQAQALAALEPRRRTPTPPPEDDDDDDFGQLSDAMAGSTVNDRSSGSSSLEPFRVPHFAAEPSPYASTSAYDRANRTRDHSGKRTLTPVMMSDAPFAPAPSSSSFSLLAPPPPPSAAPRTNSVGSTREEFGNFSGMQKGNALTRPASTGLSMSTKPLAPTPILRPTSAASISHTPLRPTSASSLPALLTKPQSPLATPRAESPAQTGAAIAPSQPTSSEIPAAVPAAAQPLSAPLLPSQPLTPLQPTRTVQPTIPPPAPVPVPVRTSTPSATLNPSAQAVIIPVQTAASTPTAPVALPKLAPPPAQTAIPKLAPPPANAPVLAAPTPSSRPILMPPPGNGQAFNPVTSASGPRPPSPQPLKPTPRYNMAPLAPKPAQPTPRMTSPTPASVTVPSTSALQPNRAPTATRSAPLLAKPLAPPSLTPSPQPTLAKSPVSSFKLAPPPGGATIRIGAGTSQEKKVSMSDTDFFDSLL